MPAKGLPETNQEKIESLEKSVSDIEASIVKMTNILSRLDAQFKEDLNIIKTQVGTIPTDNLREDVRSIKEKVGEIPTNNDIGDIDKSLNDLVVGKLNATHDSVKEIPTEINLDSFRTELNTFYDQIKQSNNETKDNLRSHINWSQGKTEEHVNWRVDRLRREDFRKLIELLSYAFHFSFSDTDAWGNHRAEKFDKALRDYFR